MSFIEQIPNPGTTDVKRAKMLIDGKWVEAADGQTLPVENPSNRRIIAEVPRGKAEDIDRAVKAAAAGEAAEPDGDGGGDDSDALDAPLLSISAPGAPPALARGAINK